MSLLIDDAALDARRLVARDSLAPLTASLAADLEPLLSLDIYFPREKALLSREGGRCARDGTLLDFDPFEPHEHHCMTCGVVYRGEMHDRFWIYWYQLWLAERAVHAALLSRLGVDVRFAALAGRILEGYAERYETYPNTDNVLGPTRLFFSTYLESIWLLQICIAADLLGDRNQSLAARVADRIIAPSTRIIAEYDEGASNRQVWNDAALLAAARMLGDDAAAERAVHGPSGITAHLSGGLLADGTWFEGENYHLFAHRGLWYGVTMAEQAGIEIPTPLVDRFQRGFATPFATALPDFTLPSRRDSQYAISLRQWRIAEHCELGLARASDPALVSALARMYDGGGARDTGRSRSSADVERNALPTKLTRADLNWRALLCALPSLPPLDVAAPRSALLDAQGIAVFRRNAGQSYVALDYGHSGGGHGHPDRLNLLVADGATRWLDDYGTGSYVDASLHWYRSTLAHNAPLVDGRSQRRVNGYLVAHDERDAAGWVVAEVDGVAPDVRVTRTLIVLSDYLVDVVEWNAATDVTVDLPFHAKIELDTGVGHTTLALPPGDGGEEDGFRFARDTAVQHAEPATTVHGIERRDEKSLNVWSCADGASEWWRAVAPGPPGSGDRAFRFVRTRGRTGRQQSVIAWSDEIVSVELSGDIRVTMRDGSTHVHRRTDMGWQIEINAGVARSSIDLAGVVTRPSAATAAVNVIESSSFSLPAPGESLVIELGEPHYRRSEQPWSEIRPTAQITIASTGESLILRIDVHTSDRTFAPADAVNLFDNEHPDINGDGVQLYLQDDDGLSAMMLIPEQSPTAVRVRAIEGSTTTRDVRAAWQRTSGGYRIDVDLPGPPPSALDVVVNEMPRGRVRRRGQLVLSGARGEFAYLRGDRHDAARLIHLHISNE